MSWIKENKTFLLLTYINILFIVTMTKICYKIEKFDYFFVTLLYIAGVLVFWFYHSVLRKGLLRFLFTLAAAGAATVYIINNYSYMSNLVNIYIVDNFNYINMNVNKGAPTVFYNYKGIFVLVLPLLAFLLTFLITLGLTNSIILFSTVLVTALWYLGYTDDIKKNLSYFIIISLITYCINNYMKNIKKLSKRGIKISINSSKIMIYTIICSVVIAGLSSIMPQEYKGKYSSELKGKFYNKFINAENGEEKGKKYKYDLSFSGYNNSSKKLGGPITINKLLAFKVKSDQSYYLRGSIKDTYDGFSWNQSEKKYNEKQNNQDSMLEDKTSMNYFGKSSMATIFPVELNSSTIFTPNFAYNAEVAKGNIYYDDIPTFMSSGIIDKPYSIYFYTLNSIGKGILSGSVSPAYKEVSNAYYVEYYKNYLQLPDNISPRVYDLVYSLTKDKKTSVQKVQAIKDYLKKNYSYTLKVSQVPEGQEFVDYFLFTEKKGYCTYFATAETIMFRIAGIPARYVEGFNMGESKDKDGLYEVRNENAHAWSEVLYLETNNQGLWYTVDAVPNAVDLIHKEEEQDKIKSENPSESGSPLTPIPNKKPKASNEELEGTSNTAIISPLILKCLYVVGIVLVFNTLLILLNYRKKTIILRCESIIPLYKHSLDRLETIGLIKGETTADLDFIASLNGELSNRVRQTAQLAYKEYYGLKEPDRFNKREYYLFIEAYIRRRQGKVKYFIKKYYFGKKISFIKSKLVLLYKKIRSI